MTSNRFGPNLKNVRLNESNTFAVDNFPISLTVFEIFQFLNFTKGNNSYKMTSNRFGPNLKNVRLNESNTFAVDNFPISLTVFQIFQF